MALYIGFSGSKPPEYSSYFWDYFIISSFLLPQKCLTFFNSSNLVLKNKYSAFEVRLPGLYQKGYL
jgi:hypothetical protein